MPSDDDTEAPVDSTAPTEQAGGDAGSMASLLKKVAATAGGGSIAPGTLLGGQYRIQRAVGAGGMGVVYLATDERLDRPVAIKLGAAHSAPALARVQREAGALAKLSHPNVVTVYQVGEHEGRVFIAMEYVAGGTARSWAVAAPRTWREVIALYAAAGDGLAAAHAAGLVHRDFKPDNVLVGDDGRPRVADFGLVRAIAVDDDAGESTDDTRDTVETRAGAIMGTPAYMPPEQLIGEDVDARADQFAFCASVWEALFGARPFGGSTPAEVKAAIESSPPATGEDRERRRGVPRQILDALRRGLRPARDERWPAMAPLLAALRNDPAVRRRRIALVLGGAAVAAAIAVPLAIHAGQPPEPCTDGPAVLAETWNPARRERIARALGGAAWPAAQARLDAYERAWTVGHRDACRATRVARSQSEDLLDRRMACLHRARIALGATLDVIERGGPAFAARAPAALDALPGVDACADTAELAATDPLPTDPTLRAQIQEATTLVAEAQAATNEDMRPGMAVLADRAVAAARAGGWKPQIAEALATRANVLYDSGDIAASVPVYQEAAELAVAGGSDRVATRLFADLAWALAASGDHAEATRAHALARALWERHGRRPADARRVLNTAAYLAQQAGRLDESIEHMRALIQLIEAGGAIGSPAADHYNLASALVSNGKLEEGLPPLARAIEIAETTDGADHANVARYLALRAHAEVGLGRHAAAEASARRAIEIYEGWFGAEDRRLPYALESLGSALEQQGRFEEAVTAIERSIAISKRHGNPLESASVEQLLAGMYEARGELARAGELAARAIATIETAAGADAPALIPALLLAGRVARARGQHEAARAAQRRAAALADREKHGDH